MSVRVRPMHYVTVEFRLLTGNKEEQNIEASGILDRRGGSTTGKP